MSCSAPIIINQSIHDKMMMLVPTLASLTADKEIHVNVLVLAHRASERLNSTQITRMDIAQEIWQSKLCDCTDGIPRSAVLLIIARLLSWKMMLWECDVIMIMYEYFVYHHILPTNEELTEFTLHIDQFQNDHAAFVEEHKVHIGASIDNFISNEKLNDEQKGCSLCFSDITTKHYKLPCGHYFHYDEDVCLEGTIKKWFNRNSKCPCCRKDMRDYGASEIRETGNQDLPSTLPSASSENSATSSNQ